jgi:hypothetical protein
MIEGAQTIDKMPLHQLPFLASRASFANGCFLEA